LLALAALALAGCGPSDGRVLGVGIPPSDAADGQAKAWAPFLADMQNATGLRVAPFYGSSETALVDSLKFRQTDVAWLDNAAALQAARKARAEVFARATRPDGSDIYRAVIVVRKGSGLTLQKLLACGRTVRFGLGEADSAPASAAPLAYLFAPRGIDPQACFKSVRAAPAEANLYAVAAGVLDAAASDTVTMTHAVFADPEAGRRTLSMVESVWSSPAIPDGPVVWRKDLDPKVKARLRKFLLSYGVGEGREAERQRKVLRGLGLKGFAPADDRHLYAVREMQATARLLRAQSRRDEAGIAAARAELAAVAAARAKAGTAR
jgi:phosphonate transport system substrate-binding protein